CMFPAKIENLRRNPVCLQRYRHVVARKRQHGLTTTLIYATTPDGVYIVLNDDPAMSYDDFLSLNERCKEMLGLK
ncbi:hypothetical protein HFK87_09265, partial [Ralstonia pseudosolanacearum]|nr:hypothetical protein [Ralstonia pseudosolanacearum]